MSDHWGAKLEESMVKDCFSRYYEDEFREKLYKKLVDELGEDTTIEKKEKLYEEFGELYSDYLNYETTQGTVEDVYEYLDNVELKWTFDLEEYRMDIAERLRGGLEDG